MSSRVSGERYGTSEQRALSFPAEAVRPFLAALDFVLITLLSVLNGLTYHFIIFEQVQTIDLFVGSGLVVAAMFVSLLHANNLYGLHRPKQGLAKVALIWTAVFLFLTGVAFILKVSDQFSRGYVLSFFVSGLGVVVVMRAMADKALRRALAVGALLGRRIALVAEETELAGGELVQTLQRHGCRIEKLVKIPKGRMEADGADESLPLMRELAAAVRQGGVAEVILAFNWAHPHLVADVMSELRMLPIPVHLVPDRASRKLLERRTTTIGPVLAVELQRAPLTWPERAAKRCLDIVASSCGLFSLLPLLAAAAIAIRLDSAGPILFRQMRMGFNGRPFQIYKFRSMNVLDDGPRIEQARRNDPRVTRVGRWLRKTSVDELPQLINVLRGEMSLVGPRPHALAHDNEYDAIIADYALRYHMKPGITGWAQINGLRGETPTVHFMKRRVDHDLWYIKNWSLWLDIRILLKTVASEFHNRDAY